jgi:hypothetical protein
VAHVVVVVVAAAVFLSVFWERIFHRLQLVSLFLP